MIQTSRIRRRTVRDRARAHRFTASLRKGRSLATHLLAAGVTDPKTIKGVRSGLYGAAGRLGIEPVKVVRAHRTVDGKGARLRVTHHYTPAQVARLVAAYKPRKPEYREAAYLLALAGAPVTVRQTVRRPAAPVRELASA